MHAAHDSRRSLGRRGGTLIASLALALLAACGGGGSAGGGGTTTGGTTTGGTTTGGSSGGSTGGTTGGEGATGMPSVHIAGLGPFSGSKVKVELLSAPGLPFAQSTTDANGLFSLSLPPNEALDEMWMLVTVEGGVDTDADSDGTRDATPTPFNSALRALVKGRWLRERSIAVSMLSEALYLSVAETLNDVPPEAIERALNTGSYQMLKGDIDLDRDGGLGYGDILAFNASRAGDRAALDFDYAAAVLRPQSIDDTSLAAKYHRGEASLIGSGVDEAFGRTIKPVLPAPDTMSTVAVTIKVGLGGTVTSPSLPGTVLGGAFGTLVHKLERSGDPLVVTATPDPSWMFSRWVGCPELIPGEPQSCRIMPNDTHIVTAQFAVASKKLAGDLILEVVPDAEPGRLGITFTSPTEMTLTACACDEEMRAIIDTLRGDMLFHTGIFDRPQVRIEDRRNRTVIPNPDGGDDLYQGRYRVSDISLADAYSAVSFSLPEEALTLDDLTAITLADPATGAMRTVKLPHPLMRGFIPGPGPSPEAAARACPGRQEAAYSYAPDGSGRMTVACVDPNASSIPSATPCASTERAVDLVDGRRYCVVDGAWESARYRNAQDLAAVLAKADATAHTAGFIKVASRPVKTQAKAKKQPIQQPEIAREVFLAGYGRALDLGRGVYLTNNPEKTGLAMLETVGPAERISDARELRRTIAETCRLNPLASGCRKRGAGGLVKTQLTPLPLPPGLDGGFTAFSLQDIELSTPKLPGFKVTVSLQVNIDVRNSGSGNYAAPLAGEVRMSGYVAVTPNLGVKLALGFGKEVLEKTGKPKPEAPNEKVEPKRLVFSIDFAKYIPKVGAIMQGDIDFSIGIELNGGLEIENRLLVPVITRYDVDAAAGLRCPEPLVTIPGIGSIPDPTSCTTNSRFDVAVRPSIQYQYRLQGRANVVVEPYAEVAVSAGIRGGFERMASIGARGFVQAEAILESPVIQITNIPQVISIQGGKKECVDGGGEARVNLWYGYRLFGRVSTADTLIGKILVLNREFPLKEQKWPIKSWGWDFGEKKALPPTEPETSILGNSTADAPEPCSGGTRPTETERAFRSGTLELQDGSFVATSTRKLTMQPDGNLVLYNYNGETATENAPIWASNTNGTFNQRALFQTDGNLVIYNLRDQARWSSGTFGNPNAVLRITEGGDVLIFKAADSYPIWGQVLIQQAGGMVLRPGDSIQTFDRRLVFQAHDGNLVLYKIENRDGVNREALWASGTNGIPIDGPNARAVFTTDGRLEVYDRNDQRRFQSSNGPIAGGGQLWLQRDGNLVIYAPGDVAVWSTGTNGR